MADLITIADQLGDFQIQEDINTESKFNAIRDEWDRLYIRKLLGAELGNLFLTNFDDNSGVPTGRYATIYAAIQEDDNGYLLESKGIKFFIKGIIWYYFARQNQITISTGGNKSSKSENAESTDNATIFARNYNASIRTGKAIQRYIRQNSSTYPEYNGQDLDFLIG